jgi:hypothetical protein
MSGTRELIARTRQKQISRHIMIGRMKPELDIISNNAAMSTCRPVVLAGRYVARGSGFPVKE